VNDLLELHGLPLAFEFSFGVFVRPPASDSLPDILRLDRASLEAVAHGLTARRNPSGLLALDSRCLGLPFAFAVNKRAIGGLAGLLGGNRAASHVVSVITLASLGISVLLCLADVLDAIGWHLHVAHERGTAISRSTPALVGLAPVLVVTLGKHVAHAVVITVAEGFAVAVVVELETCAILRFLASAASALRFLVHAWG